MAQVSIAQIQALFSITAAGQATMANSLPVVLASDQSAISVVAAQATASNLRAQTAMEGATGSAVPATAGFIGGGAAGGTGNLTGATIKAASTTAAATDTALVVTLSPNSGAPGTQNVQGSVTAVGSIAGPNTSSIGVQYLGVLPAVSQQAIPTIYDSRSQAQSMDLNGNIRVTPLATDRGGTVSARIMAASSTNATSVKAATGQVYGWFLFNTTGSALFFKLFNLSVTPTVGTSTPVITIPIPAGGGTNVSWAHGVAFSNGIGYSITGAVTDADTTYVTANSVVGWLLYK